MKQKTRAPSLSVLQQIKITEKKICIRFDSFLFAFNLFRSAQKCEITN